MAKLVKKIGILCVLVCILNAGIILLVPVDSSSYWAAIRDKHQSLEQMPSPRLIFVGGSNLAFSLDSVLIEQGLGLPVVNLGLHADLGLRFMLNEVKPYLQPTDIVIVVPEYAHFTDLPIDGTPKELAAVVEAYPAAVRYLDSPRLFFNVLTGLPQVQANKFSVAKFVHRQGAVDIYTRQGFNANGDVVSHLGQPAPGFATKEFWASPPTFQDSAFTVLNEFSSFVTSTGAKVFFMFPCLPESIYEADESEIESIHLRLAADLQIPILGSPDDLVFSAPYFFDSPYHMTSEGRKARTEKVIALLRPTMP
jgi:hypothetical protein